MSQIPSDVLAAAYPVSVAAGPFRLPPLTLQHVFALSAIESPVLDAHATTVRLRDMSTAIALMLADTQTLAPLIADALYGGAAAEPAKAKIRSLAIEAAAQIPIAQLADAFTGLQKQIAEAWRTFVPMAAEGSGSPLPAQTGAPSADPANGPGRSS